MIEHGHNGHSPANPHPGEDVVGHGPMHGNPYLSQRAVEAAPDLDAAAPVLHANEAQRLNRKALGFLAGIIGLLVLMAFWVFRGAAAGDDRIVRPKQERVMIPELPQSAGMGRAVPVAEPIGVQPYTPHANELPPLPPAPAPMQPSYAGYDTPPPPREPSLLERRMDSAASVSGQGGTAQDAYTQAMLASMRAAQPGGTAAPEPARSNATSAQYIRNPDALLVRGTYLRCVLETRIVTDIPGFTSCIVTEPVYSINGRSLLLPKGSKISGSYDTEPNGPRVSVVWDRITTPTGIDVNMASPGVDNLGGAGHPGHYDAHWPSRIASALMISLVSDAFKYAGAKHGPRTTTVTNGLITDTPFESNTARTMERLANHALDQGMRRPATVTINHGTVVNVYVAKDVDFSGVLARR
jgi:type IV secretion system protein VirB10